MNNPNIIFEAWGRKDKGQCLTPKCKYPVHQGEWCNNCLADIELKGNWTGDAWAFYQELKAAIEAQKGKQGRSAK